MEKDQKGFPLASSSRPKRSFLEFLRSSSSGKSNSKIVLALDMPHRTEIDSLLPDSIRILEKVSDFVCAVKINYHLLIPLGMREIVKLNQTIHSKDLVSIADIKLNDIDNTNEIATSYLWDCGFDGVIVNPFAGFKGALDVVYDEAHSMGKGVLSLAYMSHPGADEGYGLETKNGTIFDIMLDRANTWKSDAVILGTTRVERIIEARTKLREEIEIISPGSGAQGGDPIGSLKAGADYLIYGRTIVLAEDPRESARLIFESLKKMPPA